MPIEVTLTKKKDTKNAVQYVSDDPRLTTVYVSKDGAKEIEAGESIKVTVEPA